MNKTRIGALILVCTLVLGMTAPVGAAPASDIAGNACEQAVTALTELGILEGYPDGTFRPDASITRAETVAVFCRLLMPENGQGAGFTDLAGHWAEELILAAAAAGILQGYPDGTFQPQNPVATLELATMALRALGYAGEDYEGEAVKHGLLTADADLEAPATRGSAAILLDALLSLPMAGSEAATLKATYIAKKALAEGSVLRSFALTTGTLGQSLNGAPLAADTAVYLWDNAAKGYALADADAAKYAFAAVVDTTGDKLGDTVLLVARADSGDYWDAEAQYADPRGGAYADAYNNPYNIPYGERLLLTADEDGFLGGAASDYSNIVAPGDLDASSYWPTYDWYNSTSTDTLTILSGFKTSQQSTGWACGVTSALMALEWYVQRGDLNELDLGALRDKVDADGGFVWGGYTDTQMLINTFTHLNTMAGKDVWQWQSTYDFVAEDGSLKEEYLSTAWIKENLAAGRPILVGWNSFGGHWQVIIGYDDLGTEATADDVLILADPYDSTDHRNDGYNIQPYERLYYDWTQNFDRDFGIDADYGCTVMFMPYPADGFDYQAKKGDGLAASKGDVWAKEGNYSDDMLIPYGKTAEVLAASSYTYAKDQRGENGLAGPASSDWYRGADVKGTPYYANFDFYAKGGEISDTLILLEGFGTSQQASEWTCGISSMRMVLHWFDAMGELTEFDLAHLRKDDKEGATTLDGLIQAFEGISAGDGASDWALLGTDDMDEDWMVGDLALDGDLIPTCLEAGIPILIGWDEWGGHWQVIIGYDDMGTEATQDDVLILADPYDTTDHNQDGYVIESFERLVYGWGAAFDERGSEVFLIAAPLATMQAAGLAE